MNQAHNLFFPLDAPGNFLSLLSYLEKIGGQRFDQVRFVTAEDQETRHKHTKFYEQIEKASHHRNLLVDERDFKYKTAVCRCGCKQEIKWKVQAEVDVAIAVYLIDYALCSYVENITLFAGDRDFIDSIVYVQNRLKKNVRIMGFEENTGARLKDIGNFIDVTQDIIRFHKERLQLQKQQNKQRKRSQTPERGVNNPEQKKSQAHHMQPGEFKSMSMILDPTGTLKALQKDESAQQKYDPMKDPIVKQILKTKLSDKQTLVEGQCFKDQLFPQETLQALLKHPKISIYEAEHAIQTTEEQEDLEALIAFIFGSHQFVTGNIPKLDYDEILRQNAVA